MKANKHIAIIGAGKMGRSLAGGLLTSGYAADAICVSNPGAEKLTVLHDQWGIKTTADNRQAVADADIVILAVKPAVVPLVVDELKPLLHEKPRLLISVAAGVRTDHFINKLGDKQAIVRCMPNIPVSVGAGATGMYASLGVSNEDREWAESILRALGITLWVEQESLLDSVTALSGSGPAYFFRMMAALQEVGESLGLSAADARLLTVQTALGSARMALESDMSFAALSEQVTSPGGTTAAAMAVLDKCAVDDAFIDAVKAAKQRAVELADMSNY